MDTGTTIIDAVYSGGVFRPLGTVALPENSRVSLTISSATTSVAEWLAATAALRDEMLKKNGYYLDTADIIAEDRRRDG